MAEMTRDIFPTSPLHRIQTPINRNVVGDLARTPSRPWGNIVYPIGTGVKSNERK
jgi:hypothetical protein